MYCISLNIFNVFCVCLGIRRSDPISAMASDKDHSYHLRQSERSHSPSSTSRKRLVRTSMLIPSGTHQCQRLVFIKTTQMVKEEEAEAECQKKFCALPAPSHVNQPLYQEMMEVREKESKQGREQRKNFLLSIQKPFSFQEREREKREKLIAMLNQVSTDQKSKASTVRKSPKKAEKDLSESDLNGELIL